MTYGEKIAHLRKSNGMTQDDLGKVLNVTYQAVSKWERGESLPDFTMMSQIAKFFQVPLSYFEEDSEAAITQVQEQAPVNNIAVNYIGTCTVCGKMLKDDDEYVASPKIVCKSCVENAERKRQAEQAERERRQAYAREKARREQLGSGFDIKLAISLLLAVAAYVLIAVNAFSSSSDDVEAYGFMMLIIPISLFGIVHSIADFINDLRDSFTDDETEGYTRNLSLVIGGLFAVVNFVLYLIMYLTFNKNGFFIGFMIAGAIISFTFISQFMWGGVIKSIFTAGGFTFKLPGFIFSLTLDSILWMIVTKLLLGIVAILLFIITTVLVALVAMIGSVITFIPSVITKTVKDRNA